MNKPTTIDDLLLKYASIDDTELGEDKFNGHHNIKQAKAELATLLRSVVPEKKPDATKQGELIPFNTKNEVEMHWLRKCQDAGFNQALDQINQAINKLVGDI